MKKRRYSLCTGIVILSHICCINSVGVIPYTPEVIFTGYINDTYDSLAGNRAWPNRCVLINDTVRIYCYSTLFNELHHVRQGDLLRIDLYPDSIGTFSKENTLFHLARYHDGNESYTINKGDSIDNTIRFEAVTALFSPRIGAELELTEIFVSTPPIVQGQHLTITQGHLSGSVHRK